MDAPRENCLFFGAGFRRKLAYRRGELLDVRTGAVLRSWDVLNERFEPGERRVGFETPARWLEIYEDDQGVWLRDGSWHECLAAGGLALPDFTGRRHAAALRALHHEILVNVVDGRPLPNLAACERPRYREAALAVRVLALTGHLGLVQDWIRGLEEPYDHASGGPGESDNLGQALYLLSLAAGASHPLVSRVLEEANRRREADYLGGQTDGAAHPVYQTRWLKFGLRALGLPDAAWRVPATPDAYAAFFWLDGVRDAVSSLTAPARDDSGAGQPCLEAAAGHCLGRPPAVPELNRAPLSWGIDLPEARYRTLRRISPADEKLRRLAPHTWHAAEWFLWLWSAE